MPDMPFITVDDLIEDICSWVRELPQAIKEADLHTKLSKRLDGMGVSHKNKHRLLNANANGRSEPDILVTGVNPNLLIEFKKTGEWKLVSQAAWQLFQASELLQNDGVTTRKLAIFGSTLKDPILERMLKKLDIDWACSEGC